MSIPANLRALHARYALSGVWIVRETADGEQHILKVNHALSSLHGMRCCGQDPDPRCLRCGEIDQVIAGLESGEQWAAHDALDCLSFGSADDWPAFPSCTDEETGTPA